MFNRQKSRFAVGGSLFEISLELGCWSFELRLIQNPDPSSQ
jgi:hypothetical protein